MVASGLSGDACKDTRLFEERRKRLRGNQRTKKVIDRQAADSVDQKGLVAPVEEQRLRLRIVCLEGAQRPQVIRANRLRILNLNGPEFAAAVDDEVDLDTRSRPPEEEPRIARRICNPGPQMLRD